MDLNSAEGFRRLGLFAGGIGAFVWLAYLVTVVNFARIDPIDWLIIIGGQVFSFLVPFAFVRAVGWVVSGFRSKDK